MFLFYTACLVKTLFIRLLLSLLGMLNGSGRYLMEIHYNTILYGMKQKDNFYFTQISTILIKLLKYHNNCLDTQCLVF
jgi:hypothetical protein